MKKHTLVHLWDPSIPGKYMHAMCGETDMYYTITTVRKHDIRLVTCPTCNEVYNSWDQVERNITCQFE